MRSAAVSVKLGFASDDFGNAIELGVPIPSSSRFGRDPEIKLESVWVGQAPGRSNVVAERRGPSVRVRSETGEWHASTYDQAPFDSMMTHCADRRDGLELLLLRERMRGWRFYDQLRTDRDAPSRRPQIGTHTPVLAGDGADLAAAVQTIREIGDGAEFAAAVADAFDGAQVEVADQDGYFLLEMRQHGLLRPLTASELSDGTLRFLLLAAALLSPRPPELMVLNEPEASLHPDLLGPLARLISVAGQRSQIILVSHAEPLIMALDGEADCKPIRLYKELGETLADDEPDSSWKWPSR
jgi:predicted ATPase